MRNALTLLSLFSLKTLAVTVYNSNDPTSTYTADQSQWTGLGSQDPTTYDPPTPPAEFNPNVVVQLYDGGYDGLSMPQNGNFLGFSIELSVFEQVIGQNESSIHPEFLNHLAILSERGGSVALRIGGNTQDRAELVDQTANGRILDKDKNDVLGVTNTPVIFYTDILIKTMAQIGSMVNVYYFFGIPFIKTNTDGNAGIIVQHTQNLLGDRLLALQLANEPDLYERHKKKPPPYGPDNFYADTQSMITSLPINQNNIMGPSVCCAWETDDILNGGYVERFAPYLKYLDAMHYPQDNCDTSRVITKDDFAFYLSHAEPVKFADKYANAVGLAQSLGKPFVILESNTASCSGFAGISDTFGATIWGIDMGLQLSSRNFTNLMWHVGGLEAHYNPFTAVPGAWRKFRKWTTGAIFYSNLFVAEAIGKSGKAQLVDLKMNFGSEFTPGYAIYEEGKVARLALLNFITDQSGAHDYTAAIQIGGGETGLPGASPPSVFVKYLLSETGSVSDKFNIRWANQTLGGLFGSDGRLYGDYYVEEIPCTNNVCNVKVKAPSAALVFFSQEALANSSPTNIDDPLSFSTSMLDRPVITVDWASVAASNGRNGQMPLGSTSEGASTDTNASPRGKMVETIFVGLSLMIALLALW